MSSSLVNLPVEFNKFVVKDLLDLFVIGCYDDVVKAKITWGLQNASEILKARYLICELYSWTHMPNNCFWQQLVYTDVLEACLKESSPKTADELLKALGQVDEEENMGEMADMMKQFAEQMQKVNEDAAVTEMANDMNAKMTMRENEQEEEEEDDEAKIL